ncbi:MAG: hypothetical protein E6I19_13815 [Chloroflexi bacterium]|nr:MAG: hypothetical protein E6I19_13815 [Chloroflexota bacterium]
MTSTLVRRAVSSTLVALILALALPAAPAAAMTGTVTGKVVDSVTMQGIFDAHIYLGIPGGFIWAHSAADGSFTIDLTPGYVFGSEPANVPAAFPLVKQLVGPRSSCTDSTGLQPPPTLTQTLYLPNITRNLGGEGGWYTPFIVQNTGSAATMLEVTFYKFVDGSCVERFLVSGINPGTSYANDPRDTVKNPILPDDAQFSVVVKSYGSTVVGVVNEHQGSGTRAEALSYDGFSAGANTVYLPNITRRLFGLFVTPFIIQNLGDGVASVQATFRTFDGTGVPVTIGRTIDSGRSKPIDPNSNDFNLGAPGLTDNKQYAVTVTSNQPVAVVVNTHADAASVANPVAYAADGVTGGASTIYAAYASKNAASIDRYSTTANTYTFATPIQPNQSKAFDPRFSFSTQGTANTPCSTGGADCLADGEYSVRITASGATLAAAMNVISDVGGATAMGYAANAAPSTKFYLPNVTRTLGGANGWSTPIILQTVTASGATVEWRRFSDGALVTTQNLTIANGSAMRIDPRTVAGLSDDTQYGVTVNGTGGTLTAIVTELNFQGGDGAMTYEGFPSP